MSKADKEKSINAKDYYTQAINEAIKKTNDITVLDLAHKILLNSVKA
jgi:hypothetical protein